MHKSTKPRRLQQSKVLALIKLHLKLDYLCTLKFPEQIIPLLHKIVKGGLLATETFMIHLLVYVHFVVLCRCYFINQIHFKSIYVLVFLFANILHNKYRVYWCIYSLASNNYDGEVLQFLFLFV